MNLIELFNDLAIPQKSNGRFNALVIPKYENFRIAIDEMGNPVILIFIANTVTGSSFKNYRLKYLELQQNVECKISENGRSYCRTFTIITFTGKERNLQEYFLRISETLIRTLHSELKPNQIIETLNKFIEIFKSLNDSPTSTIQGLWTELFLIENSNEPKILLEYWHNNPEEKFDFNAGKEKIEVKSSSNFERIHFFSSEQLNPPKGSEVLIASIFVKQISSGRSVQNLIESISDKIDNDFELVTKLYKLVNNTLGNTFEQSLNIKYDYNIAKDSLKFYWTHDISKIEKIYIPDQVTQVKYKSDLENIESIKHIDNNIIGNLFRPLFLK